MRSSIEALERDISEIRAMTAAIKPANDLLIGSTNPEVRAYLSVRRRFDYSALIIALYASFERFVEDIITSYTRIIAGQDRYNALPQRLTTKHLTKTAEILFKGTMDDKRYPGITPHRLIENLHLCLSNSWPYELNHVAITAHDRNIRYDELGSMLSLVDISHDALCRAQPLLDWYCDVQKMVGEAPSSIPVTIIRQRLDEFVDRRNDVAHRGGNPSDRLGIEDMQILVEFIYALASSIFTLFVAQYLAKSHVGKATSEQLILAEKPYLKETVWVVERPGRILYIGQPIFALSTSFFVRWGRIQTLKLNDQDRSSIEPGGDETVGIRFNFRAPENSQVYILEAEDELIWPVRAG